MFASALGDKQAFASLYQATSSRLMAVAYSILGNRGMAEEALQEAFIQIWHSASYYRQDLGKPATWLTAIVRNRALDLYRKEQRRSGLGGDQQDSQELPDAAARASMSTELQELWDCMSPLPADQRESILMAYYFGHTHEEISQRVTQPLGTVKSWIRRGVNQVRGCLER